MGITGNSLPVQDPALRAILVGHGGERCLVVVLAPHAWRTVTYGNLTPPLPFKHGALP